MKFNSKMHQNQFDMATLRITWINTASWIIWEHLTSHSVQTEISLFHKGSKGYLEGTDMQLGKNKLPGIHDIIPGVTISSKVCVLVIWICNVTFTIFHCITIMSAVWQFIVIQFFIASL